MSKIISRSRSDRPETSPSLSKMWLKGIDLEQSLFPRLQASMGPLSPKEEKLMWILDFAEIETSVSNVQVTDPPKGRAEMARAFVAKQLHGSQTTRASIERLLVDKDINAEMFSFWISISKIAFISKQNSGQCRRLAIGKAQFIISGLPICRYLLD